MNVSILRDARLVVGLAAAVTLLSRERCDFIFSVAQSGCVGLSALRPVTGRPG